MRKVIAGSVLGLGALAAAAPALADAGVSPFDPYPLMSERIDVSGASTTAPGWFVFGQDAESSSTPWISSGAVPEALTQTTSGLPWLSQSGFEYGVNGQDPEAVLYGTTSVSHELLNAVTTTQFEITNPQLALDAPSWLDGVLPGSTYAVTDIGTQYRNDYSDVLTEGATKGAPDISTVHDMFQTPFGTFNLSNLFQPFGEQPQTVVTDSGLPDLFDPSTFTGSTDTTGTMGDFLGVLSL